MKELTRKFASEIKEHLRVLAIKYEDLGLVAVVDIIIKPKQDCSCIEVKITKGENE